MKNIAVASKLSYGGLEFSFRRNPRGGVEQAQFERLKEMVEGVTLSNSNDRWIFSLVGLGDLSVSSIRKLIDNAILPKEDAERKNKKEAERRAKLDEIFAKHKQIEQELEEREILRRMALA
nr:RNA-directed DNA polymerase, eukaryota [Tanacetum cinerariifolium]